MHPRRLSPPPQISGKCSQEDQVAQPLLGCWTGKTTTLCLLLGLCKAPTSYWDLGWFFFLILPPLPSPHSLLVVN